MGDTATCERMFLSVVAVTDETFGVRGVDDTVQNRHWGWRRGWIRVLGLREGTGWRRGTRSVRFARWTDRGGSGRDGLDTVAEKMAAVGHVLADFAFDGRSGVGEVLGTIIRKFLFEGEKGLIEALDHEHGEKERRESDAAVGDTVGEGPKTSTKDLHFLIVFLLDFKKLGEIGESVGGIRWGVEVLHSGDKFKASLLKLVAECLESISFEVVDDESPEVGGLCVVDAGDGPVRRRTLWVVLLCFGGVIDGGTERRPRLLGTRESGKCDAS